MNILVCLQKEVNCVTVMVMKKMFSSLVIKGICFLTQLLIDASFFLLHGNYFVPLFLVSSVYFYKIYKNKYQCAENNKSKYYIIFYLCWFVVEYFIVNTNHTGDIQPFIYLIFWVCTFGGISKFSFNRFRYIYKCSRLSCCLCNNNVHLR